jgi:hypothetical protein
MVYYLITYTNDKEFVFRARDDDDALRYIHYEGDHVSGYTKLSTEEGESLVNEYYEA